MSQATADNSLDDDALVSNTVALIGVIFLGVASVLLVLLLVLLSQLPDGIEDVRQLSATAPAQLRLLIVACATWVLNVVAFFLCLVGLFLPRRPRLLATVGTVGALLMLLGFFGVVAVGAFMNPSPPNPGSLNSLPAEQADPSEI